MRFGAYYWDVRRRPPEAVGVPLPVYFLRKITGSGKLAAIFFVLTKLDEHQNELKYTYRKTCDPDNNRNHRQSFQVPYLLLYQDLAGAKPTAPFGWPLIIL